jgi:hypothetical protein
MGLIKFFKELFGGKKVEDCDTCGCDTPESCPTPEVCEVVEVPTVEVVETKEVEVPVVKAEETKKPARRRSKAKTVTAKDIKGKSKKKSEFPIEAPVAEVAPEKKSKPRRRRKPKPKTDEGQA